MTTYVLEPQHSILLPPGALAVSLVALNQAAVGLRALRGGQVLAFDSPGRVESGVLQAAPNRVIVTRLAQPVTIEVVAPDGHPLPVGTSISVSVGAESVLHANAASAVIRGLDVSGVTAAPILELAPAEQQIRVRAVFDGGAPAEGQLAVAIAAVREYLQGSGPRPSGLRLAVVLDDSASMRPWHTSGASAAVLDLLAGIAHVLGEDSQLRIWDGAGWRAMPAREAHEFAAGLMGGQLASSRAQVPAVTDGITVLVTDEAGPCEVVSVVLCLGSAAALLPTGGAVLAMAEAPEQLTAELAQPQGGLGRLVQQLMGQLAARQEAGR